MCYWRFKIICENEDKSPPDKILESMNAEPDALQEDAHISV